MKQETGKKSKKLLWLIIALAAIVAVAGVLLGVFWSDLFGTEGPAGASAANGELYWNVDRVTFVDEETGMSNRVPDADGMYSIRFAYNGQIIELKASDKKLVNFIDTMDLLGLVLDANGMVIDAVAAKDVATEVVKDNYVSEIGKDFVRVNSSIVMTGMSNKIKFTENTKVYDVSVGANPFGAVAELKLLDCITVYADADGNVTHVFITKRSETGDIYFIFDTQYNTTLKETKRVPDENGVYTFTAAHEGQQVELKCRDKAVMNTIDAAGGLFGLKMDDEGYVIKKLEAATAMTGIKEFLNYTVTELDGDSFTATRYMIGVEQGNTYTNTIPEDADIFIVETNCTADFIGQRTELQMGDRIDLWTDLDGNPKVILVQNRKVDSPLYWNISRSFNNTTQETSRTPDENGYYNVSMVVDGKIVELRTKDKAVMTKVDALEAKGMGLKLKGNVILDAYKCDCVTGMWTAGISRYVTATSGNVIQISATRDWTNSSNYVVNKECKVYDVSGYYGVERGTKTTVRKFDCVTAFQSEANELTHVFITERYVEDSKIYYNYNKVTGRKDGITTRATDADGYYVFDMACEGKVTQVKTKDAELATWIDSQWPNYVALTVKKDGTIKNAYPARAAVKGGYNNKNGYTVKEAATKDGVVKNGWRNETTGNVGDSADLVLASDCAIYNCTQAFDDHLGEKTKLKPGDQFATISAYPKGEAAEVFVIRRQVDSPLYWHYNKYSVTVEKDAAGNTVDRYSNRPTDADGYYVFELIDNGKIVTLKTKDKDLAYQIDSNNQAFCVTSKNGIAQRVYGPTYASPDTTRLGIGGFDIMSFDEETRTMVAKRNRPQASDYGQTSTFKVREDVRVINVDKSSANFGKQDKIREGDRIVTFRDPEGRATYIFIQSEGHHEKGNVSYCEHCQKEVWWEPFLGEFCRDDTYAKTTTFHYYVVRDEERSFAPAVGHIAEDKKNYEIVLDLNGKTYTGTKNAFQIYTGDTLTIVDTVGTGKVTAKMIGKIDPGVIVCKGTLNLYSGTICPAEGAEVPKNAGCLFITENKATFNMYDGTVTGGKINNSAGGYGGNIQANKGAIINIYGGTISGGDADNGYGGNISLSSGSSINIYGGTITGGKAAFGGNIATTISGDNQQKAFVNMYGGTITNGVASNQGGNIRVYESGTNTLSLNMAGGTITNGTAANGGNLYITQADAVIGGTVENGKATSAAANVFFYTPENDTLKVTGKIGAVAADSSVDQSVRVNATQVDGAVVELDGATIAGEISMPANAKLTLSGATEIDKLKLPAGFEAELGELKEGASIGIEAKGAFTKVNENAEELKKFFYVLDEENYELKVENDQLVAKYIGTEPPAPPVTGDVDYKKDLEFQTGTNIAWCAVCQADVEWVRPYKASSYLRNTSTAAHPHIYLDADYGVNKNDYLMYTDDLEEICLHLNGFDIINANHGVLQIDGGTIMNILGTGTISGNGTYAATMYVRNGTVKMYSGTYEKASGNEKEMIMVNNRSTVYMYKDATINDASTKSSIYSNNSGDKYFIDGATVNGAVSVSSGATLTLSGAPKITKVVLKGGINHKLILGELTSGANIGIGFNDGSVGAFADTNANAATYLDYFYATATGKTVINDNGVLTITDASVAPPATTPAVTDKLTEQTGEVVAYCPVCKGDKTWVPVDPARANLTGVVTESTDKHFYLTATINGQSIHGDAIINTHGIGNACLHLNGFDLINTLGRGIYVDVATDVLNVMGTGNVIGNGGYGATIYNKGTLNLYSGNYEKGDSSTAQGTNMIMLTGGATIKLGDDVTVSEPNFKANKPTLYCNSATDKVIVDGATFDGSLSVSGGQSITVSGAPEITRLILKGGANHKLTMGELLPGTDIGIGFGNDGDGAIADTNTNAATYVDYFHAITEGKTVANDNGVLTITDASVAPPATTPAVTDKLTEQTGEVVAYCPVCKGDKTWVPVDPARANLTDIVTESTDKHFYLTATINGQSIHGDAIINTHGIGNACLHLNGFDLINTLGRGIYVDVATDVLNVMGTGTVSGNGGYGATIYNKGKLNLYGGTYTKADTNTGMLLITNPGSYLNIYDDVTFVDPTANNTIRGEGGGHISIQGAKIQGIVSATACESISVSGAPVIARLNLNETHRLNVGVLTEGASIAVNRCVGANDLTFSNAPAEYAPYFKAVNAGDAVVPTKDGKLAYAAGAIQWIDENAKTAICPVCNEIATWQALDNTTLNSVFLANVSTSKTHFFASENLTRNNSDAAIITTLGNGAGNGQSVYCLHLNGKNLTNTAGRAFYVDAQPTAESDTLNVMGAGIVTGKAGAQGIIYVRNANNSLNLYGGTYVISDTSTANIIGDFRGPVTIGNGVIFQKKDNETATNVKGTTLTMLGGEIQGILNIMDNKTSTAAATTAGNLVMKAGTVVGEVNIMKNDDVALVASATITGGYINGKLNMDAAATVNLSGAPQINYLAMPEGAKLTVGTLAARAQIYVKAVGVFTNPIIDAAEAVKHFTAAVSTDAIQVVAQDKTLQYVAAS